MVHFDISLFAMIDWAIQAENPEQRDAAARGMLRGIGIEKSENFNPSEKQKAIFNDAAAAALAYLQDTYFAHSPKASVGNDWVVLTPARSYETVFDWVVDSGAMPFRFYGPEPALFKVELLLKKLRDWISKLLKFNGWQLR